MKKLMMMAVAVLFAASANAQGDIVKLIKKAKTYSDAMQLVNQGVSALSNEDKAKVYTKVCDLAAKEFSTEQDNYIKKDLNPGGYDVNNAYTAAQNLIKSALSLRDADPKAAIKYIDPVNKAREMMLNAGQEGLDKKDFNQILSNLGLYVDAANVVYDGKVDMDPNVPQISYFATWGASELNDAENVMKYSQYALNDSAYGAPSMALLLNSMEKKVASKQDSVEFVNKLKGMIGKYPGGQADGAILGKITTFYGAPQYAGEVNKLLDETIAANPNNKMAWALKGQTALNNMDYETAITANKKAIELDPKFTQVRFNLATGQREKAMAMIDAANGNVTPEAKALVNEALANLNQIREEDPNHELVQWKYPLAQCYYILGEQAKYDEIMALP
jgi:tetratricopeptide (TPR) repeat protein